MGSGHESKMGKKVQYTSITPLPSNIPRQLAIELLHSHEEVAKLNPLVTGVKSIEAPRDAPNDEYYSEWYEISEVITWGFGLKKKIAFKGVFHNLPMGMQSHTYAPMGVDLRIKYIIGGNQPGEPREPRELGVNTPLDGLYMRQDVQIECNLALASYVKKETKDAIGKMVDRLARKAELLDEGRLHAMFEDGRLKTSKPTDFNDSDAASSVGFNPNSPPGSPSPSMMSAGFGPRLDKKGYGNYHDVARSSSISQHRSSTYMPAYQQQGYNGPDYGRTGAPNMPMINELPGDMQQGLYPQPLKPNGQSFRSELPGDTSFSNSTPSPQPSPRQPAFPPDVEKAQQYQAYQGASQPHQLHPSQRHSASASSSGYSADTKFEFAIMLRQQFIEKHIRDEMLKFGAELRHSVECTNIDISDGADYPVTASLKDLRTGIESKIQSKYIIGADGGQSFVRKHFAVPFEGGTTVDKWVRIDGKVKTNMPTARAYGSIESPTHGNVLWAPLDRGVTRIGYVFTAAQEDRCGGKIDEATAVKEAIQSVKPFKLEFESVEWWTLYVIGQRIAATYRPHPRVLLAGDACHTHSSGAAQGLNTGIHDATNLAWKLTLVLKGAAKEQLLDTYTEERKKSAQRLINFDQKIATLMGNKWPEGLPRFPEQDVNQALAELFDEASGYNTGLGLSYDENMINVSSLQNRSCISIPVGQRGPDTDLLMPGTLQPLRSHAVTPNWAKLHLLVFAGDPRSTMPRIHSLFSDIDSTISCFAENVIDLATIVALSNTRVSVEEAIGMQPTGVVYYDNRSQSHHRYGVDVRQGALVVLRPDGYIGFSTEMSAKGVELVKIYFDRFLIRRAASMTA